MSKYLIEFPKSGTSLQAEYDEKGMLIRSIFDAGAEPLSLEQFKWLFEHYPFSMKRLESYKSLASCKVSEVATDTSFAAFWSEYANKMGNKKMAEKLWNGLEESERLKALKYIPVLTQFSAQRGIEKPYATTYLNQQRWNN